MQYHVSQGGVNIGKFDEAAILRHLADGSFTYADHYWAVGMPGWKPLSQFRPQGATSAATSAPRAMSPARPQQTVGRQVAGPTPSRPSPQVAAAPDNRSQTFGYVGGGLLALGVFGPTAQVGRLAFSMMENGNSKGMAVLGLGIAGAVLSHLRLFAYVWIPAAIAALILGDVCIHIADTPTANLFGSRITLSPGWGLFVMLAGNALLFASAWIGTRDGKASSKP